MRRVGVPWYRREHYPEILSIMADAHTLAPAYDQWLRASESNEAEARRVGIEVVRVPIEPAAFTKWCAERGCARDRMARVAFVNEIMGARSD